MGGTGGAPIDFVREGAGEPVLVVHGSPGGADQGVALGRFLIRAGFEVISPSRPGYLETPLEAGPAIDEQAALLTALLVHLGLDRVRVMCWSGGGPASYRLAALDPDRVERLVALSAVSGTYAMHEDSWADRMMLSSAAGNWAIAEVMEHLPGQGVQATLSEEGDLSPAELREQRDAVLADEQALHFMRELADTVDDGEDRSGGFENDKRAFAAIGSLGLEEIAAPVLLVHGDADTDVRFEQSEAADARLARSELIRVERGTHLCTWAHPDDAEIQERVSAFLAA
jgi:pimeloyl-ACP methyl ester carboxylesterase